MQSINSKRILWLMVALLSFATTTESTLKATNPNKSHKYIAPKGKKLSKKTKPTKKAKQTKIVKKVNAIKEEKNIVSKNSTSTKLNNSNYTNLTALREDIINFATSHTGIHYRSGGYSINGFDCSGFTSYVMKYFDIFISRSSREQAIQGNAIAIEDAQRGDLIFFGHGKGISHVAMVVERTVDKLVVVHSTNSQGIVVEDIYQSKYWKSKIKYARDVVNSF